MFSKLSSACRDEILDAFASSALNTVKNILSTGSRNDVKPENTATTTAFESAKLTFGKPLVLPVYNKVVAEPVIAVSAEKKVVRIASNFPVAKPTDLYSLVDYKEIGRICKEIDAGLFVSNTKCAVWTKGGNYHHMNWDVKSVVMEVKFLQPATSLQIDQALPTMDRYRITAILRELRKQGILIVS